jgi:hypothetical protein
MSDELRLVRRKVESLNGSVGEIRDRLLNCLDTATRRPEDALALSRSIGETLAKQSLTALGIKPPLMLDACLRELEKPKVMSRGLVPGEIISMLHKVRTFGNRALHDSLRISVTAEDVASVLGDLLRVTRWYFCEFARGQRLESVFQGLADRPGGDTPPIAPTAETSRLMGKRADTEAIPSKQVQPAADRDTRLPKMPRSVKKEVAKRQAEIDWMEKNFPPTCGGQPVDEILHDWIDRIRKLQESLDQLRSGYRADA